MLAGGGEHLGDMLWWALVDTRIARTQLESIWQGAGLPMRFLPEPASPEKALKMAARECATGQADRLIRLGVENDESIVFAIVREERDEAGNVTYQQEAKVVLDRVLKTVKADDPSHELAMAMHASYLRLVNTHTCDDLRRAMLRTLDYCAAVTLRDHGGVYWVPSPYADVVRRLQLAIEQVGLSRLYVLPIHRSDDASRTLGEVAKVELEDELAALQAEMDRFAQEPPARASTLEHRLEAFDDLRAKAQMYRTILQVQVSDLEGRLDSMTRTVNRMLGVGSSAAPGPVQDTFPVIAASVPSGVPMHAP
jgi:hypothetical protein